MGGRTPETCWAVNKSQDNKLENCCMWLVIYLNWNKIIYLKFVLKLFVQVSFWKCQEICVNTSSIDCDFKRTYLTSCNIRASKTERVICNYSWNCNCLSYVGFPFTALISLYESALWYRYMTIRSARTAFILSELLRGWTWTVFRDVQAPLQ